MPDNRHHIAATILAAGESSRFGTPKQLLPFRGSTLIRSIAETVLASNVSSVHLILGAHVEQISPALAGLAVKIVHNDMWREGIASSIRAALNAVSPKSDGLLIVLGDQPFVSSPLLNQLIARFHHHSSIVACSYAGTVGVPAVFPRHVFPELLNLTGDAGAKAILHRHLDEMTLIDFPEGAVDIDAPNDLRHLS